MLYIQNRKKLAYPVPAVIWQIEPRSQIITLRPAWDPLSKFVLPKQLDEYYRYGHILALAKQIKKTGFYPWDFKYVPMVKRNLAFFTEGRFVHLGQNVLVDPWYADVIPAHFNWFNSFLDDEETPELYDRK